MAEPTLAERLVSHAQWQKPGYGWRPGMAVVWGDVIVDVGALGLWCGEVDRDDEWVLYGPRELRPDIEHPATKGWLLAQCVMMADALGVSMRMLPLFADGGTAIAEMWLHLADRMIESEGDDEL